MEYSQKPLIELMKAGKFPGEKSVPKHIETVISNVFIFEERVYKFYKNDNEFFNKGFRNISGKNERFDFTRRDFNWNSKLSPAIYLKLIGVKIINGEIQITKPEDADELVMVMKRLDTRHVLFEKLMRGEITKDESFLMGRQLGEILKSVHATTRSSRNYHGLFGERVSDLRNWIASVTDHVSKEEADMYCDFLDAFRHKHKTWFENELSNEMVHGGDLHSHNAVFSEGTLYLMDAFPPKEEWLVEHDLIPLYRIGTDIWALSGDKDLFDSFVKGYELGSGRQVNRKLDDLYVIYSAAIMVSYLYMLQRTDNEKKEAAKRFHDFVRKYHTGISS